MVEKIKISDNRANFLRKLLIIIPAFILGSAILFLADFAIISKSIKALIVNSGIIVPIVSFSVFDLSFVKGRGVILIIGLLPILLAVFYRLREKQVSKSLFAVISSITIITTRSHFILLTQIIHDFQDYSD